LSEVTTFELLPSEDMTDWMLGKESFGEETLEAFSETYELLGYEQQASIYSLGMMFYICFALVAGWCLALLLFLITLPFLCCAGCYRVVKKPYDWVRG